MSAPQLDKLVVIGVGLIGGSFALALTEAGAVRRVVGVGRSARNLEQALALGVIHEAATDYALALAGADMVLLATPVGQMAAIMRAIAPHLDANAIVTDAGSTKQDVIANARAHLGEHLRRFVPAHPIAGTEKSGAAAAHAGLFRGRRVLLTPLPENDPAAVQTVRALWLACGARVDAMAAQRHDQVFAAVSHLPHVLAFALVDLIAGRPDGAELFGLAGGAFRDCTRVAASPAEMWRDICLANREALLAELDAYQAELARLRAILAAKDSARLRELFTRANTARATLRGPRASSE